MPKGDSTLNMLIVAALVALGVGYYVPRTFSSRTPETSTNGVSSTNASTITTAVAQNPSSRNAWAASAPGRVEPAGGEIRIGAQVPGRVADVLVGVNDKVAAGDLLVRLDDEELIARVKAAVAEVAVRKRDRDNESVGRAAQDRRTAEDNLANAERQQAQSRGDLDRALKARRNGSATADADVNKARDEVMKAKDKLEDARANLRKTAADAPTPTRLEASLAAARAELSAAYAALERSRIRAAGAGTVLQVNAKVGETVAPSPEAPLVVVGELSSLRVKAELEERDIGKVRVGQAAIVRSDAFSGRDFEGRVASMGQVLGPSRIGQRGPRKPTDVDVLEILIDLDGQPPLLPGMRVDVFLKQDATAQPSGITKAN